MTERIETAGDTDALAGQFAQQFAGDAISTAGARSEAMLDVAQDSAEPEDEGEAIGAAPDAAAAVPDDTDFTADGAAEPVDEPVPDADGANAQPAIAPPAGMTEADKAVFSELPEELQRFVAGQEAGRTADYQRKTQELSETRRETEALRGELRTKLAQQIDALQAVAGRELAPPDPDLKKQDPDRYEAELARYLHGKHEQERSQALLSAAAEELAREQMTAYRNLMAEEAARLPALVPEMADPAKAEKLAGDIRAYALERGYSEDELVHAKARDVGVLHRAMMFDRAQAARSKVERQAKRAPKSQKPGTAKAGTAGGRRRFAELLDRHNEAGSVSTMAALFEEKLKGQTHG